MPVVNVKPREFTILDQRNHPLPVSVQLAGYGPRMWVSYKRPESSNADSRAMAVVQNTNVPAQQAWLAQGGAAVFYSAAATTEPVLVRATVVGINFVTVQVTPVTLIDSDHANQPDPHTKRVTVPKGMPVTLDAAVWGEDRQPPVYLGFVDAGMLAAFQQPSRLSVKCDDQETVSVCLGERALMGGVFIEVTEVGMNYVVARCRLPEPEWFVSKFVLDQ